MEGQTKQQHAVVRQLASLKVLSRLLGHELHGQQTSRSVTLSREEVIEIQTTIDLFIEEITRRQAQAPASTTPAQAPAPAAAPNEPRLVAARN
ncbi:MAG: hypothetical protein ACKVWV_13265 [Planctomycetota bacterium]